MTDISFIRQDDEGYSSLELLFEGCAKQLAPKFVGDLVFQFPAAAQKRECKVQFDWISSVLYGDEMLWSKPSYPYFKDVDGKSGLFLVHGSTYLERIKPFFPDHSHFIYFDQDFNWHITARKVEASPV